MSANMSKIRNFGKIYERCLKIFMGELQVSEEERKLAIKHLLQVDLIGHHNRAESYKRRGQKKPAKSNGFAPVPTEATPELAKRLAEYKGKEV